MRLLFFAFIFSLFSSLGFAQVEIFGSVTDSLSGEPIPFVNVFIASSTIGGATDAQGRFALPKVKAGIYEIVVSYVGYQTAVHVVRAEDGQKYQINFKISLKAKELRAVQVKALTDREWQMCFKTFKEDFIGRSSVASHAKIVNPTIINFSLHIENKQIEISGNTNEPLVIENQVLGYKVYFVLDDYQNVKNRYSSYIGKPRFEEMKPKNKRQARKWKEARLKAYKGSFQHFVKALLHNNLQGQGFSMISIQTGAGISISDGQEIKRDHVFFRTPENGIFALTFKNNLQITYQFEKEELKYAQFHWKRQAKVQTSTIQLKEQYLLIDKTGYVYNPLAAVFYGYWGWEKIAEMLPLDYEF
jgi:hypothetical protein